MIINNIFSNNGRDGFRKTTAGVSPNITMDYNNFFGNVGIPRTNVTAGMHDQALAPGYVSAAAGDYAIGTNLQALGIPGAFPASTSTGYIDIGAVQRKNLIQVGSFFHVFP
jgi:hypothetical protein